MGKITQYSIDVAITQTGPWYNVFAYMPKHGRIKKVPVATIMKNEGEYLAQIKIPHESGTIFESVRSETLDRALDSTYELINEWISVKA